MKKTTLSDVSLNITDGKHGDCVNEENSGFYFISCKDVKDGAINYESARQITEKDFSEANKRTLLEPNDILITNSGTIGRMAFVRDVPSTYKTTFQKSVAIVKPNSDIIYPLYLYYQLQCCVERFINQSNGSAQKNLLLSTMRAFELFIHDDLNTQRRIADILSAYDDLIENNRKQIKLLEEAAQRLYQEWFVDLRFPGHEHTKIVDGVPEGWEKTTLDEICSVRKETLAPNKIDIGTPYIGLEHMPRKDICLSEWGNSSEISSNKFRYYEDDILFGKIRPYFHKVGFALNSGVTSTDAIVLKSTKGLWSFLLMTVSSSEFVNYTYQNCKEGAKMPRADWKQMKSYPIMIADRTIQSTFEEQIYAITRKIKVLALQINWLSEARDRLLPKLMSGEVEV